MDQRRLVLMTIMHLRISIMPHYPHHRLLIYAPTRGQCWGFEFCKVQMHHLLGMPVGQIPTFAPLNNRGKDEEFDRWRF